MIDWSKAKTVADKSVTKKPTTKKKSITSSKRTVKKNVVIEESNDLAARGRDLSMFRKVFQGCDGCGTETIHIIKHDDISCIKCTKGYKLINTQLLKNKFNQFKVSSIVYRTDLILL